MQGYAWICNDEYDGGDRGEMSVGLVQLEREHGLQLDDFEDFSAGRYSIHLRYPDRVNELLDRFESGLRVGFFCDNRIGRDQSAGERFILEMYEAFKRRIHDQGVDAIGLYLVTNGSPSEGWLSWRESISKDRPVVHLLRGEQRWRKDMADAFGAFLAGRTYRSSKAVIDSLTRAIHDLHSLPVRVDVETIESLLEPNLASEDLALCAEIWEASFGTKAGGKDESGTSEDWAALWSSVDGVLSERGEDGLTARMLAEETRLEDLEGRMRELVTEAAEWSRGLRKRPWNPAAWTDQNPRRALCDRLRAGAALATEIVELLRTLRERERV